ncbi:hypothetical protein BB560_005545 [Smittium megazygosporum]|uniref:Zinc finger ZPR1-type domain-containing protein n=1 Tax=Smittium megazygosporum TaxID=133381 RepID=A0A2T9Z3Q5_9FUNG|nr:hypothetical protein BB560_005545 [Smittium megazygosporum]
MAEQQNNRTSPDEPLNKKQKQDHEQDNAVFQDISQDAPVTVVESLCMNCHKNGTTRLMLTKVPFFKELIIMSFECPHCNFKNNEIQSGEAAAERGHEWILKVQTKADLSREIVRTGYSTIRIPELDLELPPTKRTKLTTLEGLINEISQDLLEGQQARAEQDAHAYQVIGNIISKLQHYSSQIEPFEPFTLIIDDPSGNSFVASLTPPMLDPQLSRKFYFRTIEQEELLGFAAEAEQGQTSSEQHPVISHGATGATVSADEVFEFPSNCSSCNVPSITRMKQLEIPHFKNVILMSTTCDSCGYRSNEVKSSGAIMDKGTKITLKITSAEDLSRDLLKSETCGLQIPELDLRLSFGTLGGRFTTIEGILRQIYDDLDRDARYQGDSASEDRRKIFANFLARLQDAIDGKILPLTLILDDPVSNSYIQNLYAPDPDPNMTVEVYDRTFEQNEELGLNDIQVENYS